MEYLKKKITCSNETENEKWRASSKKYKFVSFQLIAFRRKKFLGVTV